MPTQTDPNVLPKLHVATHKVSKRIQKIGIDTTFTDIHLPTEVRKEKLAEFIRTKMAASKMKNSELAIRIKKRPSEITRWLSGKHNFSIESIFLLEKTLDCQIINLTTFEKALAENEKEWKMTINGYKKTVPAFLKVPNTPHIATQNVTEVNKVAVLNHNEG